jgi:hypothetical protein
MADVKTFKVSHSKMATFRRCLQQYQWKYIEKFYPPSNIGQTRGTAGHSALASWHVHYDATLATEAAWNSWSNAGFGDGEDWQQLYQVLLRYYEWSKANDTFVLKVAEQEFNIEYEVAGRPMIFNGFIDGIIEEKNQLWILENKFLKKMDNSSSIMDAQVSLYMLAAHLLDYNVQGVIYNKVRVGDTKVAITEPVVRTRMYRNSAGLSKVQDEMLIQVSRMMDYEKGGVPYRNPTKDCSWDCAFHQACVSMSDDGQTPIQILETITNLRSNDG